MVDGAVGTIAALTMGGLLLWRLRSQRRWTRWERDRRHELESYCTLEMTLPAGRDPRKRTERAKQVARLVTERSVFARCAVFLPDDAEQLACAGSSGMDDLSLQALREWCARCLLEERTRPAYGQDRMKMQVLPSFSVPLATRDRADRLPHEACASVTLVPIRLQRGRLVGLVAVCGSRERRLPGQRIGEAVAPLELLAAKLARTLERAMLMERLIQVERLAGAAQLAGGVAESLIDPMRAVLDRAQLIAGTTNEARTREYARAIAAEAAPMGEALCALRDAWQPREEMASTLPEEQA